MPTVKISTSKPLPIEHKINCPHLLSGGHIGVACTCLLTNEKDAEMRFEENNTTRKLIGGIEEVKDSCMQAQQGGDHYQQGKIQPIEYIHANELNFFEGNAIKYVTRNRRKKSAVEDLKKAIHYIQLQLKLMHGIDSRIEYDAVSRD